MKSEVKNLRVMKCWDNSYNSKTSWYIWNFS